MYIVFVAPRTNNLYGKIYISKRAIRHVVILTCEDCYGIARVGRINQPLKKTVIVKTEGNRIVVSVFLYLKFGVSIDPVIESVRRAIKYNVETFTGMTVECVNIDVLGIQN
jgi:uncharacterized alkaline shock family protein YloU